MGAECAEADGRGKALAAGGAVGKYCGMIRGLVVAGMILGAGMKRGAEAAPKARRPPVIHYPINALRKGIEGTLEVRYTVQPDGRVTDVTLLNEAPKELAAPVIAAVGKWNAGPAEAGDPPRPEVRTQRFQFKLAESDPPAPKRVAVTDRQLKAIKVVSPIRNEVVAPECLHAVEPVYPAELPRPGSKVTVEFEVNAEGGVANVEFPKPVAESLAAAVKTALEGWRFRPAIQDRQPVPVRVRFVFEFNRHR
jgi:TonB family protein